MDEWGKRKNGQAYKKKQTNINIGSTNESSNHISTKKILLQTEKPWEKRADKAFARFENEIWWKLYAATMYAMDLDDALEVEVYVNPNTGKVDFTENMAGSFSRDKDIVITRIKPHTIYDTQLTKEEIDKMSKKEQKEFMGKQVHQWIEDDHHYDRDEIDKQITDFHNPGI